MGNTLIIELSHREAKANPKDRDRGIKGRETSRMGSHPLSGVEVLWYNYPLNTKSFVLIVDDPSQVSDPLYYVSYDIPVGHEAIKHLDQLGNWVDFNPSAQLRIRVYALKAFTNLEPGASIEKLRRAMEGKIVATGQQWLSLALH